MDWGSPEFVIAIIALSYGAWMINNWVRAKHGYPLEDEFGGKSERIEKTDSRETEKLREQNQQLRDLMERMEDRMIVLERIVTDKGYTVAEEIEALRDKPDRKDRDSGVQMDFGASRKEQA